MSDFKILPYLITNHLWWFAKNCDGDEKKIKRELALLTVPHRQQALPEDWTEVVQMQSCPTL